MVDQRAELRMDDIRRKIQKRQTLSRREKRAFRRHYDIPEPTEIDMVLKRSARCPGNTDLRVRFETDGNMSLESRTSPDPKAQAEMLAIEQQAVRVLLRQKRDLPKEQ